MQTLSGRLPAGAFIVWLDQLMPVNPRSQMNHPYGMPACRRAWVGVGFFNSWADWVATSR
jgi:hypothetical protein